MTIGRINRTPDAMVTMRTDGCTHLAHKAEHDLRLTMGLVTAVPAHNADARHATTMLEKLLTAVDPLQAVHPATRVLVDVVGNKRYCSYATVVALTEFELHSYVSAPDRASSRRRQLDAARAAAHTNWRVQGVHGLRLLRSFVQRLQRPNAHLSETPRLHRVHLPAHAQFLNRCPVRTYPLFLRLLIRQLTRVGTPPNLPCHAAALNDAPLDALSCRCHFSCRVNRRPVPPTLPGSTEVAGAQRAFPNLQRGRPCYTYPTVDAAACA